MLVSVALHTGEESTRRDKKWAEFWSLWSYHRERFCAISRRNYTKELVPTLMEFFSSPQNQVKWKSWESQWHIEPQDFNDEAEKFSPSFWCLLGLNWNV